MRQSESARVPRLHCIWLVILVLGCREVTGPSSPLLLRVEPNKTSYRAGDTVLLIRRNVSSVPIAFSDCGPPSLERLTDRVWIALPEPAEPDANRICGDGRRVMSPGGTDTIQGHRITSAVPAGTYRYLIGKIGVGESAPLSNEPESARRSAPFLVVPL